MRLFTGGFFGPRFEAIHNLNISAMLRATSRRCFLFFILVALAFYGKQSEAWDWEDFLGSNDNIAAFKTTTLGTSEIRQMRVRDIKRRLTRTHGYSADEVGRMLDKEELMQALAFEEHKEREKELVHVKRYVLVKAIILTLIAIVVVLFWPLWVQMYEVASVNIVVYTDKKAYEARRCWELRSWEAMVGVILMGLTDGLRVWLSVSVLLSWFFSSKFFFPTPNLSIRPAQFMGESVSRGPFAKYGLNVAPMIFTWGFGFVEGQLEKFTGRALARAHQKQAKAARESETPEERATRKAARKAAKKAEREEAERRNLEAELIEKQRRKEAAAAASQKLFSSELEDEQHRKQEKELHRSLFPHLKADDDGDGVEEESGLEGTHVMEEID